MATNSVELLPLEGNRAVQFGCISASILKMERKTRTNRHSVHCKICSITQQFFLREHHKSVFLSLPADSKTSNSQKTQKTLQQTVSSTQPIPTSSAKWIKLTESVLYFNLKDMQPLDTIDDKGFRHMISQFEQRYMPPSRKTITMKYLPQMYEAEVSRIRTLTQAAKYFSLTTDLWTSRANHAYT